MLFVNNTKKTEKVRLNDGMRGGNVQGYKWETVHPGDTIDLASHHGIAMGFKEVKETEENPKVKKETKEEKNTFKKVILGIKGVGKKMANDILKRWPTEDALRKAIKDGEELALRDDVEKILLKKYKK